MEHRDNVEAVKRIGTSVLQQTSSLAQSLKLLKKKIFQNLLCIKFDDDDDDVNNELNLCRRVPFLKLTVPQPVKRLPTFLWNTKVQ